MDYTKFVSGYKTAKDKETYVKKHIIKQYLPYRIKLSIAHQIAENSTHIEINGKKVYKKDTPSQYFTTIMQLIAQYTDIEFDVKILDQTYDALMECGALQIILSVIPDSEVSEFRTLVEMYMSDIYENERDLTSFIERKLEAINLSTDQMLSSLKDMLGQIQEKEDNENNENYENIKKENNISEFPMNPPVEE